MAKLRSNDAYAWTNTAIEATTFAGIGFGALGVVALSCRGHGAALGLSIAAGVTLLTSMAIFLMVAFERARRTPLSDASSGAFAPALEVAAEQRAKRDAEQAAAAAAEAEALATVAEAAALAAADEAEEAARTQPIKTWCAASKGARRFLVTPEGEAEPHPGSVSRMRPPKGAFTDTAARVAASLHNPGGELGPVAEFSVLKPYAPPDIDGGTTAAERVAAREQADKVTPAMRKMWDAAARERAADRATRLPAMDVAMSSFEDNPYLLPLDCPTKPMR